MRVKLRSSHIAALVALASTAPACGDSAHPPRLTERRPGGEWASVTTSHDSGASAFLDGTAWIEASPFDDAPGRDGSAPPTERAADGGPDGSGTDGAPNFDEPPAVVFTEVAASAGLTSVQSVPARRASCPRSVTQGCAEDLTGGAAVGDYDGDGWVDVLLTRADDTDLLYRNLGDGTFENVAAQAGLTLNVPSNGAGFADIDNDGDLDLFVLTVGHDRFYLYVNQGDGTFVEEGSARGAALEDSHEHFGFSVSFGDYDRDGYLDAHTTEWKISRAQPALARHSRLLHNLGERSPGYFEDVTESAGVDLRGLSEEGVFSFTSQFADMDGDGYPDLAVAGDFGTSRLFYNDGDGSFTDGTALSGVGTDDNGMGSAIGDVDGDGRPDWFVTSIYCAPGRCPGVIDGNRLYRNEGARRFTDATDSCGVRDGGWGWGASFFDMDNDGDNDLVMASGVRFDSPLSDGSSHNAMRLWENAGNGRMREVAAVTGMTDRGDGKGLSVLDYDRDGDLDVLVTRHADTPLLYRNDGGNDRGFLTVELVGSSTNHMGAGAVVTVEPGAGATPIRRELSIGGQFLGQNNQVLHFGLGDADRPVHEVRVTWPLSGEEQVFTDVPRNTRLRVLEP